jgi:hypothetical protein
MKRYLGDGVYVEWSMESLVLTTENGIEVTNRIYLEPEVYKALLEFVKAELVRTTQP